MDPWRAFGCLQAMLQAIFEQWVVESMQHTLPTSLVAETFSHQRNASAQSRWLRSIWRSILSKRFGVQCLGNQNSLQAMCHILPACLGKSSNCVGDGENGKIKWKGKPTWKQNAIWEGTFKKFYLSLKTGKMKRQPEKPQLQKALNDAATVDVRRHAFSLVLHTWFFPMNWYISWLCLGLRHLLALLIFCVLKMVDEKPRKLSHWSPLQPPPQRRRFLEAFAQCTSGPKATQLALRDRTGPLRSGMELHWLSFQTTWLPCMLLMQSLDEWTSARFRKMNGVSSIS